MLFPTSPSSLRQANVKDDLLFTAVGDEATDARSRPCSCPARTVKASASDQAPMAPATVPPVLSSCLANREALMKPSPSRTLLNSHLVRQAGAPVCRSSSGHVTPSLWLSPGKKTVRVKLLPGLLGLKALRPGAVRGSVCTGRAGKSRRLCLSAAGRGGCEQWRWG